MKNRNHHRVLLRELARVRDVGGDVGGDVDPKLSELIESSAPSSKRDSRP